MHTEPNRRFKSLFREMDHKIPLDVSFLNGIRRKSGLFLRRDTQKNGLPRGLCYANEPTVVTFKPSLARASFKPSNKKAINQRTTPAQ